MKQSKKKSWYHIPDYDNQNAGLPRLTNDLFLANRSIYISKHNRYARIQNTPTNFELNYILQGQCQQIINDTPYTFYEGDVLLMDAGSAHAIEALGEDDLLINIVFSILNFFELGRIAGTK